MKQVLEYFLLVFIFVALACPPFFFIRESSQRIKEMEAETAMYECRARVMRKLFPKEYGDKR